MINIARCRSRSGWCRHLQKTNPIEEKGIWTMIIWMMLMFFITPSLILPKHPRAMHQTTWFHTIRPIMISWITVESLKIRCVSIGSLTQITILCKRVFSGMASLSDAHILCSFRHHLKSKSQSQLTKSKRSCESHDPQTTVLLWKRNRPCQTNDRVCRRKVIWRRILVHQRHV